MAELNGPRIVTDGLVLHLDAGDPRSFDGNSTTWRDLSGNGNHGTLMNGVGYTNSNKGGMVFDGVNDYINSFPLQISGNGSKTIVIFIKPNTIIRSGLLGTRNVTLGTGWGLAINRTSPGNVTYYHAGGSFLEVPANLTTNQWSNIIVTYDISSNRVTLSINGTQLGSLNEFSSINTSNFIGVIGDEENDYMSPFTGTISIVQIYNRALTQSEITQNFNATKSRFGL